jgi:hypothetical protein
MTTELTRAKEAVAASLLAFDRAGTDTVLQTVPGLAQNLRELLAAVSNPPADDVREALAREIEPTAWTEVRPHPTIYAEEPEARAQYEAYFHEGQRDRHAPSLEIADRLLSSLTFEVRPRGTVTEAEVEVALNAYLNMDADVARTTAAAEWRRRNASYMRAALEAAREVRS